MSLNTRALLIVLSALVLWSFGCGGRPSTNQTAANQQQVQRGNGTRGGTATVRLATPVKTLNYLMAEDEATIIVAFSLMQDRLVNFDHEKQQYVGGLAESWTTTPDGKSTDLKLRDGLKFSDGHALTADDVIFTLNAIYDEKTGSPGFRDAMLVDDKPIKITKVSDRELKFEYPSPVASAENYLTNLAVLPQHVLDADLKAGKLGEAWKTTADPKTVVTCGPFVVESVTAGEKVTLGRNPNYWKKDSAGTQLPYLDKMIVETIPDANNVYVRLTQGSIDLADRVRPADYGQLTTTQGPTTAKDAGPGLSIDHLWFNLNTTTPDGKPLGNEKKRAWFSNPQFRKAIATAIDRETLCNATLQGLATPLYGFVSPANKIWIKPDLPKIAYDQKKAEQMLSEAGFKKTGESDAAALSDPQGNPVEFTLVVPAENEPRKLEAASIQQDLAKLGIKMTVAPIENARVVDLWQKSFDYDAVLFGLTQTDLEPSSYQNFLLSSASVHAWQPKQKKPATEWEARIDELFDQQAREPDQAKRKQIFNEIQQLMSDQMPVIPIAARHVVAAATTRVGNWSPSPILPYSLWNADELFIRGQ